MRSTIFNVFFYAATTLYALVAVVLSLFPGRTLMMGSLRRYTRLMVWAMDKFAGIKVNVTGQDNVPKDEAVIIASKHQSFGDGLVMFSQFDDLSFVTGDHLEKFFTLKRILAKMNAVVIKSCGGAKVREKLAETSAVIREQGRRLLIYPEGHLSRAGTHHRYRKGVYHLYKDFGCSVVPVATNLGQRWSQNDWKKHTGRASVEFLEPIPPGLEKDEFMTLLQDRIERASIALLDLDDPGALDMADIGQLSENSAARKARLEREQRTGQEQSSPQSNTPESTI